MARITVAAWACWKQAQAEIEHLPEPAGTDEAEHAGHADIVLPAVQGIGHQLRPDPRQGAIGECREASAAGQAQGLGGLRRGVLQGFGEQPAEHAAGVQRQGEGPGVRPEPGRQHHQRAPDQLRHRAQRIEQESRPGSAPARRSDLPPAARRAGRAAPPAGCRWPTWPGFPAAPGQSPAGAERTGRAGRTRWRRRPSGPVPCR
ncbi:Uncharacterised protein [Pseudomonas aeruginosa]|nr:Uncharacterised protein [Pseudomonas aeruginosa]